MITASGSAGTRQSASAPDRQTAIAQVLVLGVLTASWIWWSLANGAYLGGLPYPETTLYEGIIVLCAAFGVLIWTAPWRASMRLSRFARVATTCLILFAAWTLASALWSPAPDIAVGDAQRTFAYVLAFALGIWSVALLGRRMEYAMLPLVAAVAVVGLVTMLSLAFGDDPTRYLESDGTLDYPLGYRNATAAFFLMALWPAVSLASSRNISAPIRLAALAAATLAIEVGVLCQSRGAIIGSVAALGAFLLASPHRGRSAGWLVIAALPALVCVPAAADLYGAEGVGRAVGEMHAAGAAGVIGAILALVIGAAALLVERRFSFDEPDWLTPARKRVGVRAGALTFVLVLLIAIGNPVSWLGDRFDEFQKGEPNLSAQSTRLSLNAGSNRSDVWAVAINAIEDDPVFGDGAGGFQYRYTREREEVTQYAQDAHSIELETLSELGLVGFGLLATGLIAAIAGTIRSRRLGPAAASLSAGAIGAAAYWLAHSSLDWFWPYPAVSAPVIALLGAALAPAMLAPDRAWNGRQRRVLIAMVVILALSVVPPMLSARYTRNAYEGFRTDSERAFADLRRAEFLNRLTDAPQIGTGAVARELGQKERAIEAFRQASRKRPEEWAAHYFLAQLYLPDRPDAARLELALIRELNPLGGLEVEGLEERIRRISAKR